MQRLWSLADLYHRRCPSIGYTATDIDAAMELPGFSEPLEQVGWLLQHVPIAAELENWPRDLTDSERPTDDAIHKTLQPIGRLKAS